MIIKTAEFVVSNTDISKCPKPSIPEYAFIGRSNVGKSSLINMLTNRKSLAKTSSSPGKTQLINHFIINDEWYLVDLPGYGYAKISKSKRDIWQGFIKSYLLKRENLICIFVLIDVRIKPQEIDINFMLNLSENQLPFSIAFTKADKISKNQLNINIENYKSHMLEKWEFLPDIFISSSVKQNGKDEILKYIEKLNKSEAAKGLQL
ncbi:MAG: YihA family ribosome biogenesis GTP-binding protein [Bacteroidales bacterium]|nr:YihA family ribosome biogenesis GTP-binding protein [Bacteroidales bacterium]MBN2758339.1 YihA family ribosome biogenesis GTP-binding protein [Bacteroidales bacterium]